MATNPQPPHGQFRDDHAHMDVVKGGSRGRQWWPIVILVVAAAILAAAVWILPHAPKRAIAPAASEVPPQPTGSLVQLSNLHVVRPTMPGGPMNITGTLFNNGTRESINAVQAQATFTTAQGQNVTVTAPLMGLQPDGNQQPFSNDPVKPGQRRAFEMRIEGAPQNWNGNMPALRIATVGGEAASSTVPAGQKQ